MSDQTVLTEEEESQLSGAAGTALSLAMALIVCSARVQRAPRLISVSAAHVDSCLYHGPSSQDFVDALLQGEDQVSVPTTLNVGGLDLTRPDLFAGLAETGSAAATLMDSYVRLGCQPTFTCAPYQLPGRPLRGAHVAWAESNAIVFGNSVLGIHTNRYGDLIDICAALTGRVPYAGLHVPANRLAKIRFDVDATKLASVEPDLLAALLGHHIGRRTGQLVPVVVGLDPAAVSEDWCKAFGAAAASSGGVAMFHLAGITPEAPDVQTAAGDEAPLIVDQITLADLRNAHQELSTASGSAPLGGVSIGTPHLSASELVDLAALFAGRPVRVPTYATTSRSSAALAPEACEQLESCGVVIVRDTCTYGASRIMTPDGVVLTNSAKWAYYAPAQMGYDVVLAARTDCVESAVRGEIRLENSHV